MSNNNNTIIKKRVRLIGIAETVALIKPISWDNDKGKYVSDLENGKYSINLCVDKDSPSSKKLKKTFNKLANKAKFNLKIGDESKRFKSLIRDGDDRKQFIEYKPEVYQNCWVVSLKNIFRPTIYNIDGDIFDINDNNLINEQLYRGVTLTIICDLYVLTEKTRGIFGSLAGVKVLKLTPPLNVDMTVNLGEFDLDEEEVSYFLDPDF